MNFLDAVKAMKEGKKVTRRYWGDTIAINIPGSTLICYCDCNENKSKAMDTDDVEAKDWEIYEEEELFDKEHNQYKGFNDYKFRDNRVNIILTKRDGSPQGIAIIDKVDLGGIRHCRWVLNDNGYARGFDKDKKRVYLHQLIYGSVLEGNMIDHINRDRLDNRRDNLREVNFTESILNRSVFKNNTSGETGVYYNKDDDKWIAKIMVDYKSKHLGTFDTKEEATEARKKAEKQYFDSDWNLADKKLSSMQSRENTCYSEEDIKKFIQKVKEDCIEFKEKATTNLLPRDVDEIIDKRAGNLK